MQFSNTCPNYIAPKVTFQCQTVPSVSNIQNAIASCPVGVGSSACSWTVIGLAADILSQYSVMKVPIQAILSDIGIIVNTLKQSDLAPCISSNLCSQITTMYANLENPNNITNLKDTFQIYYNWYINELCPALDQACSNSAGYPGMTAVNKKISDIVYQFGQTQLTPFQKFALNYGMWITIFLFVLVIILSMLLIFRPK